MPTSDPDVPPLEILMGNRPWTLASEAGSRASCGICGASVSDRGQAVCLGCSIAGLPFDRRLKYRRQDAEAEERRQRKAAPTFIPKAPSSPAVALASLSEKERRGIVRDHRRTAEGRAWLVAQGLMP